MAEGDVLTGRRIVSSGLSKREALFDWLRSGLVVVFALIALGAVSLALIINDRAMAVDQGVYRTDAELINGGARFVDYFYSLNAATIQFDQFRAIGMLVSEEAQERRLAYLAETDLIRRVRRARMSSQIDWNRSRTEVVNRDGGAMEVRYQVALEVNQKLHQAEIVLVLVPVERTDRNTDGVGVVSYVDVAHTPFQ